MIVLYSSDIGTYAWQKIGGVWKHFDHQLDKKILDRGKELKRLKYGR